MMKSNGTRFKGFIERIKALIRHSSKIILYWTWCSWHFLFTRLWATYHVWKSTYFAYFTETQLYQYKEFFICVPIKVFLNNEFRNKYLKSITKYSALFYLRGYFIQLATVMSCACMYDIRMMLEDARE